ncbi:MAG TPA: hypothetical protein VNE39_08390 [Planctomycetota bacterium]|nr:hypothetical protein [Planctomycetota bacterium]
MDRRKFPNGDGWPDIVGKPCSPERTRRPLPALLHRAHARHRDRTSSHP